MTAFDKSLVRFLVVYLGVYQTLHLGLNLSYLAGPVTFPPPPGACRWRGTRP